MVYSHKTRGTCTQNITVEVEDGIVKDVKFTGGCNGHSQGLAAVVKGMSTKEVIAKCRGINCNGRGTSCPDQLAQALEEIKG